VRSEGRGSEETKTSGIAVVFLSSLLTPHSSLFPAGALFRESGGIRI
jgi:hypothetical protein